MELGARLSVVSVRDVRGAISEHSMGDARGPLRRRDSGIGRAVPEGSPIDPAFLSEIRGHHHEYRNGA